MVGLCANKARGKTARSRTLGARHFKFDTRIEEVKISVCANGHPNRIKNARVIAIETMCQIMALANSSAKPREMLRV